MPDLNPNHPTRIDETQREIMLRRAVGNPLLRRPGEGFQPGEYRALHPTGGIDSAPGRPGLYGSSAAFAQQDLRQTTPMLSQQGPQFQGHVANLQAQRRNQLLGGLPPVMPMQAYQPPPKNATQGQLAQWSAPKGVSQPQMPAAPAAPQGVAATANAPRLEVDVENTLDDIFAPPRPPRGGVPLPTPTPAPQRPAMAMAPPAAPQAQPPVPRQPVAPQAPQPPPPAVTATAPPVDQFAAMEQQIMKQGQQAAEVMRQRGSPMAAAQFLATLASQAPERMTAFHQAQQLQAQNKMAEEVNAMGPEGRALNEQFRAGGIDWPRYRRAIDELQSEKTLSGLVPDIRQRFQTDPATGMVVNPENALSGLMGSYPGFADPKNQGALALRNYLAAKMDPTAFAELRGLAPYGAGQGAPDQRQRLAALLKGMPQPAMMPGQPSVAQAPPGLSAPASGGGGVGGFAGRMFGNWAGGEPGAVPGTDGLSRFMNQMFGNWAGNEPIVRPRPQVQLPQAPTVALPEASNMTPGRMTGSQAIRKNLSPLVNSRWWNWAGG